MVPVVKVQGRYPLVLQDNFNGTYTSVVQDFDVDAKNITLSNKGSGNNTISLNLVDSLGNSQNILKATLATGTGTMTPDLYVMQGSMIMITSTDSLDYYILLTKAK